MHSIGIDVSADDFTTSCVLPQFDASTGTLDFSLVWFDKSFLQNLSGWKAFVNHLNSHVGDKTPCKIVMECTGVYSEKLSHFLFQQGFSTYVEPPQKVHAAFYEKGKTDPIDSRQIAEYGIRFADKLHPWQPREEVIDRIATLLSTREQLIKIKSGCRNMLRALQRKHYSMQTIQQTYQELVDDMRSRVLAVEQEITQQIATNPFLKDTTEHIISIPNIGKLVAWNMLIITNGYTQHLKYQQLASYIGVCPWEYRSGKSIYRRPQADGAGPVRLRKQLYLAAMRLRKNHPEFKKYFERKVAEGKKPRLALTNIQNRALKLICGVIKSGKPYIENYRSVF